MKEDLQIFDLIRKERARQQSGLEHLSRQTGIAANENQRLFFRITAKINRSRTAQTISQLRCQAYICLTANTISTK